MFPDELASAGTAGVRIAGLWEGGASEGVMRYSLVEKANGPAIRGGPKGDVLPSGKARVQARPASLPLGSIR